MSGQVALLERLIEKLPPGRTRRRYEALLVDELQQQVTCPTMRERVAAFVREAAEAYEALSPVARQAIVPKLLAFHDQINAAYRHMDGRTFESALTEAKRLFDQPQPASSES